MTLEENLSSAKRLEEKIQENYENPIYLGGQAFTSKNNIEKNTSSEENLKKIHLLIHPKKKSNM